MFLNDPDYVKDVNDNFFSMPLDQHYSNDDEDCTVALQHGKNLGKVEKTMNFDFNSVSMKEIRKNSISPKESRVSTKNSSRKSSFNSMTNMILNNSHKKMKVQEFLNEDFEVKIKRIKMEVCRSMLARLYVKNLKIDSKSSTKGYDFYEVLIIN